MGFQDRRYDDNKYRDGGGGMRFLQGVSSFFDWSLPLFTVPRKVPYIGGIRVRLHILYILVVLGRLYGVYRDGASIPNFGIWMVTLFVLVLLHEFGHCIACRWVGGTAEQILMWPLGGLAFCSPAKLWKPMLITTIGGPLVNLILLPVLGGALLAIGAGWRDLVFNPFSPGALSDAVFTAQWRYWLWSTYYMNLVLLLFNMLVPMFPMDCGRIVQELLWSKLGYKRSMQIATTLGLIVAVMLGLFGLATDHTNLLAIAIFGGFTCYNEKQKLALEEDVPAWAYDTDNGHRGFDNEVTRAEAKAAQALIRRQQREQHDAAKIEKEVDRILEKIKKSGIQSLSDREKEILKSATERTRGNA